MKGTTIDNLDIKDHVRWANDQANLDTTYITEAQSVAHHPALLGTSTIYSSEWETLFEWQKRNVPWASFAPPSKYHLASRRLFSFRLFPSIHLEEEEVDKEDSSQQRADASASNHLLKQVISTNPISSQSATLFEKDKTAIIDLLESIRYLNQLLAQVTARKLQYQKG